MVYHVLPGVRGEIYGGRPTEASRLSALQQTHMHFVVGALQTKIAIIILNEIDSRE